METIKNAKQAIIKVLDKITSTKWICGNCTRGDINGGTEINSKGEENKKYSKG